MVQMIKDYGKSLDWNIGSLFAHDAYVWKLVDVLNELGYVNPIKYVFGSIPCLFQGGRVAPRNAELKDAYSIFDEYNKRNIGCRLTFSSTLIRENDLTNTLCNSLMSYLNDKGKEANNGVIVSSDLLAKYIRQNYPNLQVISSQVKPSVEVGLGTEEENLDYYNSLFDLYDIVVVNPFKAIDGNFISGLKYTERVEFIANHRCVPNCPMAKLHYETQMKLGVAALDGADLTDFVNTLDEINKKCLGVKASYPLAGTSMSQSTIENLVRKGFTQFKIEGRDNDGICFIRDLGDYIFETYLYQRVANAIMQEAV